MHRFVAVGCSATCGAALYPDEAMDGKSHPDMWANLVHRNIFPDFQIYNPSRNGGGHLEIFEIACAELLSQKQSSPIHTMIVFWTSIPRYVLEPGLELYTTTVFLHATEFQDINLNEGIIPKRFLKTLSQQFLALHHPHHDILKIVTYSNFLIKLAALTGTQIYFLTASDWDDDYFVRLPTQNLVPSDLTPYTQKILNVWNRDDSEILALYDKIHDEYDRAGGINHDHWINANKPRLLQPRYAPDKGFDGVHGGPQWHHKVYRIVQEFLHNETTADRG